MATRNSQRLNFSAGSLALVALGILGTGCGSQNGPLPPPAFVGAATNYPTGTSCGAGQFNLAGYCIPATSFQQACSLIRGTLITIAGVENCRMELNLRDQYPSSTLSFMPGSVPILSPSNRHSPYRLGLPVRRGDKLLWSVTGGWGSTIANAYGFIGIGFDFFATASCTDLTVKGTRASTGVTYNYQGNPVQVYGTDGTNVFALGSGSDLVGGSYTIEGDGELAIGFNTEPGRFCGQINFSNVIGRHCESATQITSPCP